MHIDVIGVTNIVLLSMERRCRNCIDVVVKRLDYLHEYELALRETGMYKMKSKTILSL